MRIKENSRRAVLLPVDLAAALRAATLPLRRRAIAFGLRAFPLPLVGRG
jgi:hypothetical protein